MSLIHIDDSNDIKNFLTLYATKKYLLTLEPGFIGLQKKRSVLNFNEKGGGGAPSKSVPRG